jgi:hypothetical protein
MMNFDEAREQLAVARDALDAAVAALPEQRLVLALRVALEKLTVMDRDAPALILKKIAGQVTDQSARAGAGGEEEGTAGVGASGV